MPRSFFERSARLPLALLGAGWVVQHCYLPYLADGPFRVVSVFDPDTSRAQALACALPGVTVARDAAEAIAASSCAVFVATPNHTHVDLCARGLRAGRAVLCEKPVAIGEEDFRRITAAARDGGGFIVSAAVCRYRADARRWLDDCVRAGTPRAVRLSWRRERGIPAASSWHTCAHGGWTGVLPDLGYHLLDLALHALAAPGSSFERLRASYVRSGASASADWYGAAGAAASLVPDRFAGALRCQGIELEIDARWTDDEARDITQLDFDGEYGRASLNGLFGLSLERRNAEQRCTYRPHGGETAEAVDFEPGPPQHMEACAAVLDLFAKACRRGDAPDELAHLARMARAMELFGAADPKVETYYAC